MKIAHLWYTVPLFGGAEVWTIGLSKALQKLGIQSEIVCWGREEPIKHPGFLKVLGGTVSRSPDIIDVLMNGAFMAERLSEYDLLCAHHKDVLFPAVFSKSLHGSQVACMLHEPPIEWELSGEGLVSYRHVSERNQQRSTVGKMFMPYADFFLTNSRWNQQLYEKYEGISPVPLLTGVDHELFKPNQQLRDEYRDKLQIKEDTILLFYASAAGRRKRHEILLRALRALIAEGHDVKCILTCSTDRMTKTFHPLVGRIIEELHLEADVFAFPATSDETLLGLYNACDIYVHPANNEHLGMAITEAMATGKPIVAQSNGGVPELVEDGVSGFLFKTDSIQHMVQCIEKLIPDGNLRAAMGKNALERSRGFDWQEVAKKFLDVVC